MAVYAKNLLSHLAGVGELGAVDSPEIHVGILAFEAARAMSKLITLHRALTANSFSTLCNTKIKFTGVVHLNSDDEPYLLRIACAEFLSDLNHIASAISRLSATSTAPWPRGFSHVYSDLKSGSADFHLRLCFPAHMLDKKVKKMEALVFATSSLHGEMEKLAEMEVSEKKLEQWKAYNGLVPANGGDSHANNPPGADAFLKKLGMQRKLVKKLQDESLWNQSKEKVSELMAHAAITVFTRICTVFEKYVTELPVVTDRHGKFWAAPKIDIPGVNLMSSHLDRPGGINGTAPKFPGQIPRSTQIVPVKMELAKWTTKTLEPPPESCGAAGLALRYAEVISLAEKMLHLPSNSTEHKEEREELYQLLPGTLRTALRTRLKSSSGEMGINGVPAVEGRRVLEWLAPIAHDTIKWYSQKSCEKQSIDPVSKVFMLQTLEISDRKAVEMRIVDVVVAVNSVFHSDSGRKHV
ncbi:hypothetical protein ZOSMA_239G00150 [Zostera marina]|uniref:Uncharacterized protein n=1 Tax=Zostera marina TaxID=29655 RepID=A0A0K9PHQ8_ZOSMR|nr:hypothetical protein ZOSMA_239G00150 [Zostera marina]